MTVALASVIGSLLIIRDRVNGYCSAAVVPTLDVWPAIDREFAKGAFHWFFFLQPGDLPERLLAADPDAFLDATLNQMAAGSTSCIRVPSLTIVQRFANLRYAMR